MQLTAPYRTPDDDPSKGSNATESITIIKTLTSPPPLTAPNWGCLDVVDRNSIPNDGAPRQYAIACMRTNGGPVPTGWYVPSGLTGNEVWFPHGNHPRGRLHYSETYGPCMNTASALLPGGAIEVGVIAFSGDRPRNGLTPAWRPLFKANSTVPVQTGLADEIVAWDDNRRTDLVRNGLNIYALDESGPSPTLGSLVASIPSSFWNTYYWDLFGNSAITHRIFVAATNEIWTFQGAPDLNPGIPAGVWFVKCDGSNQVGTIAVPAGIQQYWSPNNFAMVYDRDNGRVLIAQTRHSWTLSQNIYATYPVDLWEVNPATRVFTKRTDMPDIAARVFDDSTVGRTPLMHLGGIRFALASPTSSFDSGTVLNSDGARHIATENTRFFEIQVPPASLPRQIKFTRYAAHKTDGNPWDARHWFGKHTRWAYRTTDGRVYCHGGDFAYSGSSIDDSYRQDMYSVLPEQPTTWRQEQPYCLPLAQGWQPLRPDECGFVWDASRDLFWVTRGMIGSDSVTHCVGINDPRFFSKVATWDPKVANNRWTEVILTYDTNLQDWPTFESSRHANRDEATDRIVRMGIIKGSFGINIVKCATSRVSCAYLRQEALRNPGAVPSYVAASLGFSSWADALSPEYSALDPATGNFYFFDWRTGDLFYVDTRAPLTIGSDGMENAALYWILRANVQNETENEGHLTWCNGVLVLVMRLVRGRGRWYTWAPGETRLYEHPVPYDCRANQLATFKVGGVEKMFGVGAADTPVAYIVDQSYIVAEFA